MSLRISYQFAYLWRAWYRNQGSHRRAVISMETLKGYFGRRYIIVAGLCPALGYGQKVAIFAWDAGGGYRIGWTRQIYTEYLPKIAI